MNKLKIAVLYGGRSAEHEVSVQSGKTIIDALGQMPEKYIVIPIYIPKEDDFDYNALRIADVVFPAVHGKNGEDGSIQGFCQLYGIPIVGSGVLSSSLCMDKPVSKRLTASIPGLHQVPFVDFFADSLDNFSALEPLISSKLGYPCFVKPVNTGSSLGMTKATGKESLREAILTAAEHDKRIMAEKFMSGRELEVGIIGNRKPIVSGVGEIVTPDGFYDYDAKYTKGGADVIISADIEKNTHEKVRELALLIYKTLLCEGMARVDFFLEHGTNKIYFNETNTIPGFTATSMFPMLFTAMGMSISELCDKLVELAIEAAKK